MLSLARKTLNNGRKRPDLDKQNFDCNLKCNSDDMQLKGYMLRWEIIGRGNLHSYLMNDRQGSEQELSLYLQNTLGSQKPFVWTDSVRIRTSNPVTAEVLDQHPTLKQLLEYVTSSIKEDSANRKSLISQLGYAWTTSFNHEEQDDERLPLDEETLNNIIEDATQLLLEGLAEGGEA